MTALGRELDYADELRLELEALEDASLDRVCALLAERNERVRELAALQLDETEPPAPASHSDLPSRQLTVHESFTPHEARSALGDRLAVFVMLGRGPTRSHVVTPSVVSLASDKAATVASAVAASTSPSSIDVFLRLAGEPRYLYAGKARSVVRGELLLAEKLPSAEFHRLGGAPWTLTTVHEDGARELLQSADASDLERALAAFRAKLPGHLSVVHSASEDALIIHVRAANALVEVVPAGDASRRFIALPENARPESAPRSFSCPCGSSLTVSGFWVWSVKDALALVRGYLRDGALPSLSSEPPATVTPHSWVERYRAGEHAQVYAELVALGPRVRSPELLGAAGEAMNELMRRVAANLERIAAALRELGYAFAADEPIVPPDDQLRASLLALEEKAGPLPLSLSSFYRVVGTVDFTQADAQLDRALDAHSEQRSLGVLGQLGPLAIPPPGFLMSQERGERAFIAEDCTKAGFSGDYLYIVLPNPAADFYLRWGDFEEHERFVDYLRNVVRWGGFRGHFCHDPQAQADEQGYVSPPIGLVGEAMRGALPF
ncbi:MAG: hypothetical protein U0271_38130 [Polyangiaceae bacterium]